MAFIGAHFWGKFWLMFKKDISKSNKQGKHIPF